MKELGIVASERKMALMVCILMISLIFSGPAYAVLPPYAFIGTVISKNPQSRMIMIQTEYTWASGGWETHSRELEGVAPNENATNEINIGDYLIAASLGVPGGSWVTLAKVKSSTQRVITDIYGDPMYGFDTPLLGDYVLEYNNIPDCSSCDGCNCDARYAIVTIMSQGNASCTHQLSPFESYIYPDAHHSVDITFLSGQAPSYPECSSIPCLGPQPVSNFVIHIDGDHEYMNRDSSDSDGGGCFVATTAN